jgi:hypothetical protein
MARIFNIYFYYEGSMHSAIVSVRKTPFFVEYTLNIFNEELFTLLPGNKIISKAPDHFMFQNASSGYSSDLMNAIIRAVSEHMQSIEAS